MHIRHILFDLDGTLLPMNQDEFVTFYMPLLAKKYISEGISFDPKAFIASVWKGYGAMVNNDGSCTKRIALDFYANEFNQAIAVTQPNSLSDKVVKKAKEKGIRTYLATNPVFPKVATMNRIKWAGLDAEDFELITTYEDNCYCKPNVDYYRTILEQFHLRPEECLMVGNDVEEDLAIRKLGVKTFLVTDTKENKKDLPIESDYQGSMEELFAFVENLENA